MQKAGPCTARSSARPFCLDEDVNKSNINNMILIKTTQPLLMRWPSFTVWPSNGPATVLFFNNVSKDNTFCKNNISYDHLLWRQRSRFDLVTLCRKNINFVAKYLLHFFFQNYVSCRWVQAGIFRLKRARAMKVLSRAKLGHFNFWAEIEP